MRLRNSSLLLVTLSAALGGAFSLLAQTPDNPPQGFGGPPPGGGPGFDGPPPFGGGGFGPRGPGGFGGPGDFGGRGGFGGPGGMQQERKLVAQFDKDGDKRLNAEERKAAREFMRQNGGGRGFGGPGGRRGGRGGPGGEFSEPAQPGQRLSPSDVKSFPEAPVYDPDTLRTFFLEFENADWELELADFNNTDVEVPATLTVDGKTYKDVGVHFRGMTSFMMVPAGRKRPLNLSLDFVHEDQNFGGYRTFNLLNAHEDPTFLRTVLFLHIAREYIPAPRANFVRVVINGESWGVYPSQQQFNKDFARDFFGTTKGARWKVPGSPGGRGGLAYLGDDPAAYQRIYEIKSKDTAESWADLIRLCKVLNQTPADQLEQALEPLLDVDGALKFLAVEVALINNDGYWIRSSDYSIYQDEKGRFHVLPCDANETLTGAGGPGFGGGGRGGRGGRGGGFGGGPEFGGPQFGGRGGTGGPAGPEGPGGPGGGFDQPPGGQPGGGFAGGPPGGPGGMPGRGPGPGFGGGMGGGGVELDPLVGLNDSSKSLRSKLLAVPALRARYLGYVRDIAEKWLDWNKLGPLAKQYHAVIAEDVKVDTRKLSTTEAFLSGLDSDVSGSAQAGFGGGRGGPGGPRMSLKAFADRRRAFLLNHAEVKSATAR